MTGVLGYVLIFIAGALLCNGIPHLLSGLRGDPFPSPFAKPPGRGNSSPVVNVLWGFGNGLAGGLLAIRWIPHYVSPREDALFVAGFLVMALFCAHHFGKVRG
jgi:hypothetical protein